MDLVTNSPVPAPQTDRIRNWALVLTKWFDKNQRDLPWRRTADPYAVWISEIMLQQTRIEAVIPYYERFMDRFPTVRELADAPEEDVLKYWEGLGYYSRARNLHKAAKKIRNEGSFPKTQAEWMLLPGIGEYTGGAIAAIAFGQETVAVDGNVMRVVSRLESLTGNVLEESSRKTVKELLFSGYPSGHAGFFVQGLMELGERICLPKEPQCEVCPLKEYCLARMQGKEKELPIREKKQVKKEETRQVFIVRDEIGRLLLNKRSSKGVLAGLYELPNIVKRSDDPKEMEKDLEMTYGMQLHPEKRIGDTKHVFTHIVWHLEVWEASAGIITGKETLEHRAEEDVMLPTAFKKLLGMERQEKKGKAL